MAINMQMISPGGALPCGLTGGSSRAKDDQSKTFEKYPQNAVSFYINPQTEVHEPENWVIWQHLVCNENFLQFFIAKLMEENKKTSKFMYNYCCKGCND